MEDPLSDLIPELLGLVGFGHSDSLSCSDYGDYVYPVCTEITACINGPQQDLYLTDKT